MNTKLIMTISTLVMGGAGILLSFFPQEIRKYLSGDASSRLDAVVLQLLGATYFAFAMMNWTARSNMIGGIYARPVSIGNLIHFCIGFLALLKASAAAYDIRLLTITLVYFLFAVLFTLVFFSTPAKIKNV